MKWFRVIGFILIANGATVSGVALFPEPWIYVNAFLWGTWMFIAVKRYGR